MSEVGVAGSGGEPKVSYSTDWPPLRRTVRRLESAPTTVASRVVTWPF
jgi:hypothetical protein